MTRPQQTTLQNMEGQLLTNETEPVFELDQDSDHHRSHGPDTNEQDTMTEAEQKTESKKGEVCCGCMEMWPEEVLEFMEDCYCCYCVSCWADMIETALRQRQVLYCCGYEVDIPEKIKENYTSLADQYKKLRDEIYAVNAMYCANHECNMYLGDIKREKVEVLCQECGQRSCASCRHGMAEHTEGSQQCPQDTFAEEIQGVIAKFSYQKCPTCRVLVEKIDGCDSIECVRCRTAFCYVCGETLHRTPCACNRATTQTPELQEPTDQEDLDDESIESFNELAIDPGNYMYDEDLG